MIKMEPSLMTSLNEAQSFVDINKKAGCICPACGQSATDWRKKMISTAVASLCSLVSKYNGKTAVHLDDFNVLPKDRNFSQLILWGLIVPHSNDEKQKRSSGKWRPTELGIKFANGETMVQPYVITYNNKVIAFEGEPVSVQSILQSKFDYSKLINNK